MSNDSPSAHEPELPATVVAGLRDDCTYLRGIRRGIEKESLRVTMEGALSARPHPAALGSPLTHPHITTDFSEAQLELITGVHTNADASLTQLEDVHRYVYQQLEDELLWTASMPCILGGDEDIPVGQYGSSNIAMAKTVYRRGLGHRYGGLMQTISGIHYNFSLPDAFWPRYAHIIGRTNDQDFITDAYFGLIRNFRRYSWLLIYLFGASPAICRSFARNLEHNLEGLDEGSLYLPHATSLRMGRLGYQSDAQSSLHVSYNCLDDYAETMVQALTQSYPDYEKIGVLVEGEYRQLNTSLIQIENEFYGTIRPKRPIQQGERPLNALRTRGVEYVEVRCLDLNPFLTVGIDTEQILFLDAFLMFCLLADSPPDSPEESARMLDNQLAIVERGRAPRLQLAGGFRDHLAHAILDACRPVAELLDCAHGGSAHEDAWQAQHMRVEDTSLTPSSRILDVMNSQEIPFFRFAMNASLAHKADFGRRPLSGKQLAHHRALALESIKRQKEIENADTVDFGAFLESYLHL
ncbi:MAG: glutamate--cysteine ligase [Pseudomonadales bacterium]|nr:glutamate--cysteine ligase [Pseudomonadales bacterium]MDP6469857.1 glutamate--cysteine ligase [Pseudomonadales bacterium]MDP6827541.1 glutamate--cysteine ligase [Pseudomonadales bacterium]MDP6971327.1 glutamate--cysteine ligase [Pseudomonadales bacterium]